MSMIPEHMLVQAISDNLPIAEQVYDITSSFVNNNNLRGWGIFDHPVVEKRKPKKKDRFIRELYDDMENLEPDAIADLQDSIVDDLKPINEPFEGVEKDVENFADNALEDIYPDGDDWLAQNHDALQYVNFFRWIINFVFVGIPWFGFSLLMEVADIVMQIIFNGYWADGNPYLIAVSVYICIQTWFSWALVFEIPWYLSELRLLRVFSLVAAWTYMLYYLFVTLDWVYMLWFEPQSTYEDYDLPSVLYNMFLAYNIVFNLHLIPVNFFIMIKEIALEIFPPLLDQDVGEELNWEDA